MDELHVGEARLLRERIAALEDRILRRLGTRDAAAHRLVGRVFSQGAIPTTAGKFYACHPVTVTGDEVEGGTPVLTVDTARAFLVDLLGGTAVAGDDLVCRRVEHRWVARVGGTPTPPPSCGTLCMPTTGCVSRILPGVAITLTYKPVASVAVNSGGSGYTVPPSVSFGTANGNGAVGVAVLTGGVVTSINITTGGAYTTAPTVTLAGGVGGTGAVAGAATLGSPVTVGTATSTGQLTAIARTAAGSGYTSPPDVAIGGVGTGATAVAIISGPISSVTVANPGANYTTTPTPTIAPATGSGGNVRVLLTGTSVASVTPATGGVYGTTNPMPTVTLATPTGHTGSGATASSRMGLNNISTLAGGSGYTVGDVLTVVGGTSTTAATVTVTAVGAGGAVTGVAIAVNGVYSAYPPTPIATAGGTGSGATLNTGWRVTAVAVNSGGTNYSTAPTVTFSAGTATATAALVPTTIASVTVVSGGTYTSPPAITLSGGGGGTGGALTAAIAAYSVGGFTVTSPGSGYVQASTTVTVTAAGGGPGSGATGNPTVVVQACFSIPTAGTYSYSATHPTGTNYADATGTAAATCSNSASVNLGPAAGYSCTQVGCCPAGQPDPGPGPYVNTYFPPDTFLLSDGIGTVTMTRSTNPGFTNPTWQGCAPRAAAQVIGDCLDPSMSAPGSVNVYFQLACNSPGVLNFTVCIAGCTPYTGNSPPHDGQNCDGSTISGSTTWCLGSNMTISCAGGTLSGSLTVNFTNSAGSVGHYQIYGGPATFSVSS